MIEESSTIIRSIKALPGFAAGLHKITLKLGGLENLVYKTLQLRIQATVLHLMKERGEVRLVVVKPRQIRSSTYFLSLTHHQMYEMAGTQSLIVTHRGAITDELFSTIKRFQDYMPDDVKIQAKKDNEEILYLQNESKAKVATAGSDAARGFPCRILLASELGRFTGRQVLDYQEGALQTLATGLGSIGIAESTSGGNGNYFHDLAKEGLDPRERWQTLFFGFQEEPEYVLTPPKNWEPDSDEKELAKAFNLTQEQLYWRHSKLKSEFRGSVTAFNREYPATFDMAFEATGGKLIDYLAVIKARKNNITVDPLKPIIMGVDPAGSGDRTSIVLRQGNVIFKHYVYRDMDDATLTGIVNRLMNNHQVRSTFIDMGYGHGVVSNLRDLGRFNVIGVHFGSRAAQSHLYKNKRAEMAADFKEWMEQGVNSQGGLVKIPDDDEFADDIKAIPELKFSGSKGLFYLPPKEEIKKELGKSTDIFDATILTFAFPIKSDIQERAYTNSNQLTSILQTERTFAALQSDNAKDTITVNPDFKYYSFGERE